MKNYKSVFLTLVLTGAAFVIGAAEEVKAVPGAALYVYRITTDADRPEANADPITVVVDKSNGFGYGNLRKDPETNKLFNQDVFMVWKGYIQIPAPGIYTFSASFLSSGGRWGNIVVFQLNGKDFLSIHHLNKVKLNDSRSVSLAKGSYEITVIYKAKGLCHDFTLKYWRKDKPFKKYSVIPSGMLHAE